MVLSQKLLSPGAPGVLQEREQGSPTQHQAGVAWIRPMMGETLGARPAGPLCVQPSLTEALCLPSAPWPRPHHFLPGGSEAAPPTPTPPSATASSLPAGVGSVDTGRSRSRDAAKEGLGPHKAGRGRKEPGPADTSMSDSCLPNTASQVALAVKNLPANPWWLGW